MLGGDLDDEALLAGATRGSRARLRGFCPALGGIDEEVGAIVVNQTGGT